MSNTLIARGLLVVVVAALGVGIALFAPQGRAVPTGRQAIPEVRDYYELVAPSRGKTIPIVWGDYGQQLVATGAIDREGFLSLYKDDPVRYEFAKRLLDERVDEPLVMTRENSGVILNALWAFGLANKNVILENGPMTDKQYGGTDRFASTGGWSLSMGDSMNHYSAYELVVLTGEQQALVEKVSKGIYRPCCDNSTYFPDCNHGMAMLALLEIAASQGASEEQLYEAALAVNGYWFTGSYADIAQFLDEYRTGWVNTAPETIVGREFSSISGYYAIREKITPQQAASGASCGA